MRVGGANLHECQEGEHKVALSVEYLCCKLSCEDCMGLKEREVT